MVSDIASTINHRMLAGPCLQMELYVETPKVKCDKCGIEYTDTESVEMVKKWVSDGYSPCPNIPCNGQLYVVTANSK